MLTIWCISFHKYTDASFARAQLLKYFYLYPRCHIEQKVSDFMIFLSNTYIRLMTGRSWACSGSCSRSVVIFGTSLSLTSHIQSVTKSHGFHLSSSTLLHIHCHHLLLAYARISSRLQYFPFSVFLHLALPRLLPCWSSPNNCLLFRFHFLVLFLPEKIFFYKPIQAGFGIPFVCFLCTVYISIIPLLSHHDTAFCLLICIPH